MSAQFGDTHLPDEQQKALKKAKRLQIISLVYLVTAVSVVAAVMGSSQAMKAAWIEDMLAFLPPIAFLIAARAARHDPDHDNPYGSTAPSGRHTWPQPWRCSPWVSSSWRTRR